MKLFSYPLQAIPLVILIGSLSSCSSKPEVSKFSDSANPKQEMTKLEIAMENSKRQDVDLLAPASYTEAKHALQKAQEMENSKKSDKKVLSEIALGRAYLERAQKHATSSSMKMKDILAARDAAIEAQARSYFPTKIETLDSSLKVETAKIENDKTNDLKEKRPLLITGYLDLELAAIKMKYLGRSKTIIDDSIRKGAEDLAPKTLSQVNSKYAEADQYITQNRYDDIQITAKANEVQKEAEGLATTTATAQGLTSETPEETALRIQAEEESLHKTRSALDQEKEMRAELAASNTKMTEEQKLNDLYEKARTKFTPEEAQVYKEGKSLVIRLRGIEFKRSEAVLQKQNFSLLKKVEDVMESFPKSAVTVEGHTDSTGSERLNRKLSAQRAEAVKEYLEVNTTDKISTIKAEGFGYERPISSNKTKEGRAQNRRVDVIIQPLQL